MFIHDQDHFRSLSDLADFQHDIVKAALANSIVITRLLCNALNGTGVLFVEATEQIQGLFNRALHKSLE